MHHIQSEARGPARLSSLLISLRGAFFSAFPLLESLIQTFLLSLVFYFKSSPTGLLNSCVTPFLSFVNSAANSVPLKCNSYLILPLIKSFELSLHFLVNSSTTSFKKFKTLYNLIPTHPFRLNFPLLRCMCRMLPPAQLNCLPCTETSYASLSPTTLFPVSAYEIWPIFQSPPQLLLLQRVIWILPVCPP